MPSRFDYVGYDQTAGVFQSRAKMISGYLEALIEELPAGRAQAMAFTKLEETYMWIGKAIRDDQIARNGTAPLQENRNDSASITLTDGSPVTPDHRELKADGQQKGYIVLSKEERAKGFVRPVRTTYTHEKCGYTTTMSLPLAETYARDPKFYNGTYCSTCGGHFPVAEFTWFGTDEKVGS